MTPVTVVQEAVLLEYAISCGVFATTTQRFWETLNATLLAADPVARIPLGGPQVIPSKEEMADAPGLAPTANHKCCVGEYATPLTKLFVELHGVDAAFHVVPSIEYASRLDAASTLPPAATHRLAFGAYVTLYAVVNKEEEEETPHEFPLDE